MTQHNPLVVDPVIHDRLQPLFNALIGVRTSSLMLHHCYSRMLTRKNECGLPSFEEWPNKAASVGIDFHAEPIWTVIMREWMTVYRDWCDAIALAQTALNTPEVVGMMNTGESRVSKRWTVKANLDLAALAATMHPMFFGGVDGLGFIRNGLPPLPAAFEKQAIKIAEHSNTVRAIHSAAATAIKPRRKRRRPPTSQVVKAFTPTETNSMTAVLKHGGNIAAAARELQRDPKTVRGNYDRALNKAAKINGRQSRSVGASQFPTDKRGQPPV